MLLQIQQYLVTNLHSAVPQQSLETSFPLESFMLGVAEMSYASVKLCNCHSSLAGRQQIRLARELSFLDQWLQIKAPVAICGLCSRVLVLSLVLKELWWHVIKLLDVI